MPLPPSDNSLPAITERIRVILEHQRGPTLDDLAESLLLEPSAFRRLIEEPSSAPDASFVLDVVVSLAYCQGVDPQWLLTGRYDGMIHRQVLSLGEERSAGGMQRMREFVQGQFERLRSNTSPYLSFLP
ncbi:MAG: hypothetical protein ACJ796_02255 [Gemmatimonadaceae bacterium]